MSVKPVNLEALRAHVQDLNDMGLGDVSYGTPTDAIIALIDIAEAAREYDRATWTHTDPPLRRRLRETLQKVS